MQLNPAGFATTIHVIYDQTFIRLSYQHQCILSVHGMSRHLNEVSLQTLSYKLVGTRKNTNYDLYVYNN